MALTGFVVEQHGGEEFFYFPAFAGGCVGECGEYVESFGHRGAGGGDTENGGQGWTLLFGVVMPGGADPFQKEQLGVDPESPFGVMLE